MPKVTLTDVASDSRSATALLVPVILGAVMGLLVIITNPVEIDSKFDEFALGKETVSLYARLGDFPIHCRTPRDGAACINGFKARGAKRAALWLGNSQIHAVNQLQEGQETAPLQLFGKLRDHGLDLITFSQPNANLQEHYVLFEYLRHHLPIDLLILSLLFDDMRETGLRPPIKNVTANPEVTQALRSSGMGQLVNNNSGSQDAAGNDLAALVDTAQERSEIALNSWLDSHSRLWGARPEVRGKLFVSLHRLRNYVLGITPSSKRKVIRGPYELNRKALEALLGSANAVGIKVFLYIVPLRSDLESPYVPAEYEAYKAEMLAIADAINVPILNLEDLVPGEHWGTKDSTTMGGGAEIDFQHFRAPGHQLLADAIYEGILPLVRSADAQ